MLRHVQFITSNENFSVQINLLLVLVAFVKSAIRPDEPRVEELSTEDESSDVAKSAGGKESSVNEID